MLQKIIWLSYIALIFLVISCINHNEKELKTSVKYIGDNGYKPDSINDLRDSILVLTFTSLFEKDSVEIRTTETSKNTVLITNKITGLAEIIDLGKIKNQKEISLRLNNNKPVKIIANSKDQLFVIKHYDDSLIIESVYHLPKFE